MLGQIGEDEGGRNYVKFLKQTGVNCDNISEIKGV